MKTWVLWTHYECEVGVSLWATAEDAYQALRDDWLDDCDDDCGHDPKSTDNSEIASALEYHFDELSYEIIQLNVPVPVTTPEDIESMGQTIRAALNGINPNAPAVPVISSDRAGELLSSLESFKEGS
jgi:hypothetical protein